MTVPAVELVWKVGIKTEEEAIEEIQYDGMEGLHWFSVARYISIINSRTVI